MATSDGIRLQKYIADAGVASRRAAEKLILDGRVEVNGELIQILGTRVSDGDQVAVDGQRIEVPRKKVYLALNKPRGYVCSSVASSKFPSFLELFPHRFRSCHHVGRLDVASEGLLLVTNDGRFTEVVTHPRFEVVKRYVVTVDGVIDADLAAKCCKGATMDGEHLRFREMRRLQSPSHPIKFEVDLIGGKNREIRRLLGFFGVNVRRLCRVQIDEIRIGDLGTGDWRHLSRKEISGVLGLQSR